MTDTCQVSVKRTISSVKSSFIFSNNVTFRVPEPKFWFGYPRRLPSTRLPDIPDTALDRVIHFYKKFDCFDHELILMIDFRFLLIMYILFYWQDHDGLIERWKHKNMENLLELHNKTPVWNEGTCLCLSKRELKWEGKFNTLKG